MPGNMLDGFLNTSYVFPLFRRARNIHIQEHQSSALEPASLSRPMQGPSSVDLSGAKAGFGAGNLAATSKLPGKENKTPRCSVMGVSSRKFTFYFMKEKGGRRQSWRESWM